MDVRQLEMFRAVVEEGAFIRAAERLHVSQSAISRQLQLLEQELKTLLLHRTGRGVTLTPDGEVLLNTAHRVNSELQEAVSQISGARELQHGLVSLGGGMTVALYIFPKLLKKFRSLYKNVDLRVTTGETDALLRLLRTRQLDLALLTLPIVAADLEIRPVLKEEMVIVTPTNHVLTRERIVDPKRLARYPFVLFEAGSNTRKEIDDFFLEEEIPVNVVMQTENVEIIKAMVASGLGITILPFSAIAPDLRHGRFAWARIRARRLYRETGWVYLKSEYLPRAVTEVLRVFDEMKRQFGGKPPGR
ncbi:MAG TPA: LysR family transcriptional regulator [Thermoanaerobaculia bacterium]